MLANDCQLSAPAEWATSACKRVRTLYVTKRAGAMTKLREWLPCVCVLHAWTAMTSSQCNAQAKCEQH
eukprot:15457953-Alexandrium_andersonii.AAC.1